MYIMCISIWCYIFFLCYWYKIIFIDINKICILLGKWSNFFILWEKCMKLDVFDYVWFCYFFNVMFNIVYNVCSFYGKNFFDNYFVYILYWMIWYIGV